MLVKNGEMLLIMNDEIYIKGNSAYAHINFACIYNVFLLCSECTMLAVLESNRTNTRNVI